MALDSSSQEAKTLRKCYPFTTMPVQCFNQLCANLNVSELSKGDFLFHRKDKTDAFIYLIEGSISLETDGLYVETVDANSTKFALAHQFPRKISARAINNVRYISLQLDAFDQSKIQYEEKKSDYMKDNDISENDSPTKDDWISALLSLPIFQRLPATNLQQVIISLQEVLLKQGEILFHQGDDADYYYVIKRGKCILSRKASERAKEIKLATLGENATFGADGLLSGEPRSQTVTAVTDMVLARIEKERFLKLIKEPALRYITYADLILEQTATTAPTIIDLRSAEEYKDDHIPGSKNLPFFSLRMHLSTFKKENKKVILTCTDSSLADAAGFFLINNKVDAVILKGGMQSRPKDEVDSAEATFTIDDGNDKKLSEEDALTNLDEQKNQLKPSEQSNEQSLQQENNTLKTENARLTKDLEKVKKKYRMLYKQTEKLKAVLEKLQN